MKTITIEDDLYTFIASQTKHIGESASDILRRLLTPEGTEVPASTEVVTDEELGITMPHTFEIYSSDLQRRHGCPTLDKVRELGVQLDNKFWTIQNLQKLGY